MCLGRFRAAPKPPPLLFLPGISGIPGRRAGKRGCLTDSAGEYVFAQRCPVGLPLLPGVLPHPQALSAYS